jgi:hypothetical protein
MTQLVDPNVPAVAPQLAPILNPAAQAPAPAPWYQGVQNFMASDAGRAALLAFGAQAIRGQQPGQTWGSSLADAIGAGARGYQGAQEFQMKQDAVARQTKVQDEQLALQRRGVEQGDKRLEIETGRAEDQKASALVERDLKVVEAKLKKNRTEPIGEDFAKKWGIPASTTWEQAESSGKIDNWREVSAAGRSGSVAASVQNLNAVEAYIRKANPGLKDDEVAKRVLEHSKERASLSEQDSYAAFLANNWDGRPETMGKMEKAFQASRKYTGPAATRPAGGEAPPPAPTGTKVLTEAQLQATMKKEGWSRATALAEAQKLGYTMQGATKGAGQ